MSNNPQRLLNRFLAMSGVGYVQSAIDVGIADADIDTRHKCDITMEEIVLRNDTRDCRGQDLINQNLRTRGLRLTLNYSEVTPAILAFWAAYYFGASANPTGSPLDEVQTITRTGTVSGGTFTLALTLEGRTVTTTPIAWNATNAAIQDALTAARMKFIQPGDVVVTGTWGTAITVTFGGRLAKANLANLVADVTSLTGSIPGLTVANSAQGAQYFHAITRSTGTEKSRFSFVLGWDTVTDRFEKYIGFVCDTFNPSFPRRQNATLQVSLIGPWEPEILTSLTVPECENITPLLTDDCKVLIDGNWETTDINTLSINLNDNVPTDEASAYGFDDVDIQTLERGDQPTYGITTGIFASEADAVYQLAYNERTEAPVDVKIHCGQPGNRLSILAPYAKVKFQNNRMTTAGTLRRSVVQLDITPFSSGGLPPVKAEAYVDQSTAFLATAP